VPGVFTAGDTIDEAMRQATEVLEFAAEDWQNPDGSQSFPPPRTIEELKNDTEFQENAADAMVALVPLLTKRETVRVRLPRNSNLKSTRSAKLFDDIFRAVRSRRRIQLQYRGRMRVVEVHALGYTRGNDPVMLAWQLSTDNLAPKPAWRLLRLEAVENYEIMGDAVETPRPDYEAWASRIDQIAYQL
jgi:predicted RNase H-like HicB family nuclease